MNTRTYQHNWYLNHKKECADYARKYREEHGEVDRLHRKEYKNKRKSEVLAHYNRDGKVSCVICGESRLPCLSIDHINGGGSEHRRQIGIVGGEKFYDWLRKQNFPEGYQTLCMNCQFMKRAENKELNSVNK